MKRTLVLLIFVNFFLVSKAQSYMFEDNFDSNDSNWNEEISKKSSVSIRDGFLQLMSKKPDVLNTWAICPVNVNPSSNFHVECNVKIECKTERCTFGYLFNYINDDNYSLLYVFQHGYCAIKTIEDGYASMSLKNKIKLPAQVKSLLNFSMTKNFNEIKFSLNNMTIATIDNYKSLSGEFGLFISGKQTVKFDNLRISQ